MDPEQTGTKPAKKSGVMHFKWWFWGIIGLILIGAIVLLAMKFTGKTTTSTENVLTKPDTAEEIKIKQNMSSLRGDIVRFYEEKKTYEGWKPNDAATNQVKAMGSELKTQALTKDNYIIYAKLPTSKTVFCMDKTFTGEVKSLSGWAKSCQ